MRIISGRAKGRRLHVPKTQNTRPILDRQKEALFNILREQLPCGTVLDLFAGSGGLGFEALSRGAEHAVFFERGREALLALTRNLEELGFKDQGWIQRGDLFRADFGRIPGPVDLVFLDPPFPLVDSEPAKIRGLLVRLVAGCNLGEEPLLVLRVPRKTDVAPLLQDVREVDRRDMGESLVLLLAPAAGTQSEPAVPLSDEGEPGADR